MIENLLAGFPVVKRPQPNQFCRGVIHRALHARMERLAGAINVAQGAINVAPTNLESF